jgi:hypothetical protein
VIAFALAALGYGIWQIKTGQRDKRVMLGMLAIWMVLLMFGYFL